MCSLAHIEARRPATVNDFDAQCCVVEAKARPYRLQRRAEGRAETRRRIVAATVRLHESVGPAATTVSAIAALAGVQRHTVYDHFPDDATLLAACSRHYREDHPPPDAGRWERIRDPARRLRRGLADLYAYYAENSLMIASILRDAEVMNVGEGFRRLERDAAAALAPAAGLPSARARRAAAGLACAFSTWQALARAGLAPRAAANLMAELLRPR